MKKLIWIAVALSISSGVMADAPNGWDNHYYEKKVNTNKKSIQQQTDELMKEFEDSMKKIKDEAYKSWKIVDDKRTWCKRNPSKRFTKGCVRVKVSPWSPIDELEARIRVLEQRSR